MVVPFMKGISTGAGGGVGGVGGAGFRSSCDEHAAASSMPAIIIAWLGLILGKITST